jgi:hypothetical protein
LWRISAAISRARPNFLSATAMVGKLCWIKL